MLAQTLVAATFAVIGLGDKPFWFDEAVSVSIAERSLGEMAEVLTKTEASMAMYYVLLHGWLSIGSDEPWVRALSALFAVATVPTTALLALRLFGPAVAVIAGSLLALNEFLHFYAEEARSYALALFLITVASWFFVSVVEGKSRRSLVAYAVVGTAAVYANLFTSLILGSHLVSLVFLRPAKPALYRVAAAQLVIGVLSVVPAALLLSAGFDASWVPDLSYTLLQFTVTEMTGNRWLALLLALLVLVAGVHAWSVLRGRQRGYESWRRAFVVTWLVLPPLLLLVVSVVEPLFVPRYLIGCLPALALVAALGLDWIRRRSPLLAAGVAAAIALFSLIELAELERADWKYEDSRAAASWVLEEKTAGDGIAYAPAHLRVGFDYYLRRLAASREELPSDFALAEHGRPEEVGNVYASEVDAQTLVRRLRRHQRVWLVSSRVKWHPTPEPMLTDGVRVLGTSYRRLARRSFGGIRVTLYAREPTAATTLPARFSSGDG